MKGLYKVLPPFTPDYSGVCSVLFELGGIMVIHDAGGCTGNFTGYDEPRWYGSSSAVYSSELREVDAILGDDEKLIGRIKNASSGLNRKFIAIIGSPAPMVIGTDYTALASILQQRTGLPVLIFDTNGIQYYDYGASLAFLELARHFVRPATAGSGNGVNIIGASALDIGKKALGKLTAFLYDAGYRVISCWAMGATLDDISRAAEAGLNIVISHSGLEAARYMERQHGIPYITGIPVGKEPVYSFFEDIRSRMGIGESVYSPRGNERPAPCLYRTLIIGEQVACNSLRTCLRADMGFIDVTVASFFGMDSAIAEKNDCHFDNEDDFPTLVQEHNYDIIIGDPLYYELIEQFWKGRYVDIPHVALSSRLYWDYDRDYIGKVGLAFLQDKIFKRWGDIDPEE